MKLKLLAILFSQLQAIFGCFENNIDYEWYDLEQMAAKAASQCQRQCFEHSQCEYWTWNRNLDWCYLKKEGAIKNKVPYSNAISGPKRCPDEGCYENNIDYQWYDLEQMPARGASQCQAQCFEHNQCEYWTWNGILNRCYLKKDGAIKNKVPYTNAISGPKHCLSEVQDILDACGKTGNFDASYIAGPPNDNESNPVGQWPWMASLGKYEENKWQHMCGATLVTNHHFLTAAHCAKLEFKIRIGDSNHASKKDDRNALDLDIIAAFMHPKYVPNRAYFDVAILETRPVKFSTAVRPICLPKEQSNDVKKYDEHFVDLIGWGQKNTHGGTSNKLERVSLKIHSQSYCNITHLHPTVSIKDIIKRHLPQLFQSHILCAGVPIGTQGSCLGDSGGPLMQHDSINNQWVQIATVQGGFKCGDSDLPGLYIRLDNPSVLSFINSIIGTE